MPNYQTCPHCGEKWDSSNRYTSPANAFLDREWWRNEHLTGECLSKVDHSFLPVAGHPDDNECTYREDGTDATYCGLTEGEHSWVM